MTSKTVQYLMLTVACAIFGFLVASKPAQPGEIKFTCDLVYQGVAIVGPDPASLVALAASYGYTVSPSQKRAATRCLRRRGQWAKLSSTSTAKP